VKRKNCPKKSDCYHLKQTRTISVLRRPRARPGPCRSVLSLSPCLAAVAAGKISRLTDRGLISRPRTICCGNNWHGNKLLGNKVLLKKLTVAQLVKRYSLLLCNRKVHYNAHKIQSIDHNLSHMNPGHIFINLFREVQLNINLPSTPTSSLVISSLWVSRPIFCMRLSSCSWFSCAIAWADEELHDDFKFRRNKCRTTAYICVVWFKFKWNVRQLYVTYFIYYITNRSLFDDMTKSSSLQIFVSLQSYVFSYTFSIFGSRLCLRQFEIFVFRYNPLKLMQI
jgi:hypothetical protein